MVQPIGYINKCTERHYKAWIGFLIKSCVDSLMTEEVQHTQYELYCMLQLMYNLMVITEAQ